MNQRRRFIWGSAGVLALTGGWLTLREKKSLVRHVKPLPRGLDSATPKPYNILMIVTDQERFDLPRQLALPGHQKLLETGTQFSQYYVNTTPCSPSRSNIYFGQHNQKTKMIVNLDVFPQPQIPDDLPSLGHYLRAQGYYTAYKGKWHLSDMKGNYELQYEAYPNSQHALEPFGFSDYNIDGDPHGSTWTGFKNDASIASNASNWLERTAKNLPDHQPWFLTVNFVNPHDVMYYSSGDHQVQTRGNPDYLSPLALPPTEAPYDKEWRFAMPKSFHAADLDNKPEAHRRYKEFCDVAYGQIPDDEAAWMAYQNYYFNCIRDADRHMLSVLEALEKTGQAQNTIVIFTADHGEMAGAHGLRQKGPFMYQENMRVPLVIRHPDVKRPQQTEALACAVDLIPTILEFAGVSKQKITELYPELPGTSFAQVVHRPDTKTTRDERGILLNYDVPLYMDPDFVESSMKHNVKGDAWMPLRSFLKTGVPFPSTKHYSFFRGIHTGDYKFARYFKPSEHHVPTDWEMLLKHNQLELYNVNDDPHELNNLAANPEQHKELILQLNQRLNDLIALEIGEDLGDEIMGPRFMKVLKT
jgi:arylsulfatase A-like enzyme